MALHVAAALVGFGSVALAGFYAASARSPDRLHLPGVLEETARYFTARGVAEWALLVVPIAGVAAVAADPSGGGLRQLWVGLALALWVLVAVVVGLASRPARARLITGLRSVPIDADTVSAAASTLAWAAAVCDVMFVLALADMVLQPG